MYHSMVSLTGETSLLQYVDDNCHYRFLIRVMEAGYLLIPLYCNHFQTAEDSYFWKQHFVKCTSEGVSKQKLLVTCRDLGKVGTLHVIAVHLDFAGLVTVADPKYSSLPSWPLLDFIATDYAKKAVEISALKSAVLEDYAPIPPTSSTP